MPPSAAHIECEEFSPFAAFCRAFTSLILSLVPGANTHTSASVRLPPVARIRHGIYRRRDMSDTHRSCFKTVPDWHALSVTVLPGTGTRVPS